MKNLDKERIILRGEPGTGKTTLAELIINRYLQFNLDKNYAEESEIKKSWIKIYEESRKKLIKIISGANNSSKLNEEYTKNITFVKQLYFDDNEKKLKRNRWAFDEEIFDITGDSINKITTDLDSLVLTSKIILQGIRLGWQDKSNKEEGYIIEKNEAKKGYVAYCPLNGNANDKFKCFLIDQNESMAATNCEKPPEVSISLSKLGYYYLRKGEFDEAINYFQQAININRDTLSEKHHLLESLYQPLLVSANLLDEIKRKSKRQYITWSSLKGMIISYLENNKKNSSLLQKEKSDIESATDKFKNMLRHRPVEFSNEKWKKIGIDTLSYIT